MENFNKTLSFLLGLVVVIVFFAVVTGKINLKDKLSFLHKENLLTSQPVKKNKTITPTPVIFKTKKTISNNQGEKNNVREQVNNLKTIPATGFPTSAIPFLTTTIITGFYIKKRW